MKKIKVLTDIEWTTTWMAVRYACGRSSIASHMLAGHIVQQYYNRMTKLQTDMLARDVRGILNDYPTYNELDARHWNKFANAMDKDSHFNVKLKDKSIHVVFNANDRIYPLKEYIENPFVERYVVNEDIIK